MVKSSVADFPHRSRINEALLKLQENGKINELKDIWWKKKRDSPLCPVRVVLPIVC
jgi:ABC-type amino acid transport substrate-binding protein